MNNNKSLRNINNNFTNRDFNKVFERNINNNPNYDEETDTIIYINQNKNILPHDKSIKDNINTLNNILSTGKFSLNNIDHIFTISLLLIFFGSILYVIFNIFS